MRQIGTVPSETDALRVTDYLLARGIRTQVESTNGVWAIWAYDEDRVEEARRDLAEYRERPEDPRYDDAHEAASQLREQMIREARQRPRVVDLRKRWDRPTVVQRSVTILLIAISAVVAILTKFGEDREGHLQQALSITTYEVSGDQVRWNPRLREVRSGQVWRLFTPMFLHFTPIHLLFNMMMLHSLGSVIEYRRGSWRLALMVLLISGLSNYAQFQFRTSLFGGMSGSPLFGGMSGVDYGLFGYLWMKSRYEPEMGIYLHPNNVIFMIGFLVLCTTGLVGPVANTVHVVGLATGMLLGIAPVLWRRVVHG